MDRFTRLWLCWGGLIAILLTLPACGNSSPSASLNSRYGYSNTQQIIIPEHYPHNGFVLSEAALAHDQGKAVLETLLRKGAAFVYILETRDSKTAAPHADSRVRRLQSKAAGAISPWARDWGPVGTLGRHANVIKLLDTVKRHPTFAEDAAVDLLAQASGLEKVEAPFPLPLSSFMTNNYGDCFLDELVVKSPRGERGLDFEEMRQMLQDFGGCRRVVNLTHFSSNGLELVLDQWAKFISDDEVLVASIVNDVGESLETTALATFLDNQAKTILGLGYEVVRVPLQVVQEKGVWRIYAWTASLMIQDTLILPRFPRLAAEQPDYDALEKRLQKELTWRGFNVQFVDADAFVMEGGSLHRAFLQLAASKS